MSNITISSNAAGTATFTVTSPATSTNQVLTLPDATDTLATVANVTASSATQIGIGQTWQVVTGSRALNTNYTNSTARPIMVSVEVTQGSSGVGRLRVDGVDVAGHSMSSVGERVTLYTIVPPSSVYQLATVSGTQTIFSWAELR